MSIHNDTSAPSVGFNNWYWLAVAYGTFRHAQSSNLVNWLGSPIATDTYFILQGSEDSDGDGVYDDVDNCPDTPNQDQLNTDGADDGGDACDTDDDNDNWLDVDDNCPIDANPQQEDSDQDGVGDTCDNCSIFSNPLQEDLNADGCGDVCESAGCAGIVCVNP